MLERFSTNIALDATGIVSLFIMAFSVSGREESKGKRNRTLFEIFQILIAMMALDILSCIYNGRSDALALLHTLKTFSLVLPMILNMLFFHYVHIELNLPSSKWKGTNHTVMLIVAFFIVAILLNPVHRLFFDVSPDTGEFVEGKYHFLCIGASALMLVVCLVQLHLHKPVSAKKRFIMTVYCLIPLLSLILQPVFHSFLLLNMAALSTALVIYAESYLDQYMEMSQKELELQNTRAALVLSQIQPHFLFNSITTVMDLCDTDPLEAKAALQEFSDYLHYKISALSNSHIVPFQEDMEYVQNYLKLEKRRYKDRLRVEWDIRATDFQIPLLTLQPLVENAIRHGISKKSGGGLVRISSRETQDCFHVTVEDDGVGFDTQAQINTVGQHVGLANVRMRLAALSGGALLVDSSPGVGTKVEILIKKETRSSTK